VCAVQFFSRISSSPTPSDATTNFSQEVQGLMCVVMVFSTAALTLHSVIDKYVCFCECVCVHARARLCVCVCVCVLERVHGCAFACAWVKMFVVFQTAFVSEAFGTQTLCYKCVCAHAPARTMSTCTHAIHRVGQDRMFTPYMTVYLVISLPTIPCIHRIYIWFWPALQPCVVHLPGRNTIRLSCSACCMYPQHCCWRATHSACTLI